ncbi:hypothetical protein N4T20_18665 [Flavobacterium sp. TR2]|uniref:hypothetical protein n=1 Tax=Flavobacterium sp. TR2 TaxID=2977321 RepID=UPI0021B0E4CF|nr:hypothetical protein [Flavobacterium sp. TR2]UWY27735.1 hypothetical protein N4T20_18665 [Flavobacterium sp. TR2]
MKKRVLLVAMLQLFMVLGGCSSDSGNDSSSVDKQKITADYVADVASTSDFVISNDNRVYLYGEKDFELKEIDLTGKVTSLKAFLDANFLNSRLSISKTGEIFLISPESDLNKDKIFRFENNFKELNIFYTMKPVSSPFATKIKLTSIAENKDNTYFVYDFNNKQMKRFIPELNGDVFVAGSEKREIKDGTGLNAGFSIVTKILSQNNVLYLIDNFDPGNSEKSFSSNIRKLEYVNNEWKVTTLLSSTTETFIDLAFDSKNEFYVLIKDKGISKLNLQSNTLSAFKEGQFEVRKENHFYGFPSKDIQSMKIKGDDIYITYANYLIKISDFQTKFAAAEKK